ncbi:hypothetical protein ACYOEI_14260, partial [Singulisphaera rosea]
MRPVATTAAVILSLVQNMIRRTPSVREVTARDVVAWIVVRPAAKGIADRIVRVARARGTV